MTKHLISPLLLLLFFSGCWVRIPDSGPEEARKHIGEAYSLNRDIILVSVLTVPMAWETKDKERIGQNQKIITTLKAESKIEIIGIVHRRLPAGIFYYFVCKDLESKIKFDLEFSLGDSIGLPDYL